MGAAAAAYAAMIDAAAAQRQRLPRGEGDNPDRWSGPLARRMNIDPRRTPTANLTAVLDLVGPADVAVDVGGGAGRLALPLALRCREAINVDPSPGMAAEFASAAAAAGITNARLVAAPWEEAEGVSGDLVLTANVTYFVRDIVPFVARMQAAARRRVAILVWSVPPPQQDAALYELAFGEVQAPVPSYRELLPVLWEMGILPDVRVLPDDFREGGLPQTREEALRWAVLRLRTDPEQVQPRIAPHLDALFTPTPRGFVPRWRPDARELLITWPTDRNGR